MTPSIRLDRLLSRVNALSKIGEYQTGNTRLAFSDEDRLARDQVVAWMREAGLTVHVDAIGNIFGLTSTNGDERCVLMGSHIDTVVGGGKYDGNLGVLAGIEVIQTLQENRLPTRHPLGVAIFSNEEGVRYAPDMMGSLVFSGGLSAEDALQVVGTDGTTVGAELSRIGYAGKPNCGFAIENVEAYIELHIEQGPILAAEHIPIGCVESVQGISWNEFTIKGVANHAGTTPLRLRRDAGYVATRIAVEVRALCQKMGSNQVGTVGCLTLTPNLINVIPELARMTVDLRNTDEQALLQCEQQLAAFIASVAAAENATVDSRTLVRTQPVKFDPGVLSVIEQEAGRLGLRARRMPSGAGHDAQFVATKARAAMIFIPSVGGISHNVTEHTDPQDIENGANVLLGAIARLAGCTQLGS